MINKKALTFVELIIVIGIILLLSTIGFYSYYNYLPDSRDASRLETLSQIKKSMDLYKIRYRLPVPDRKVDVKVDNLLTSYQGYLSDEILDNIDFSFNGKYRGKDPKDNTFYTYYLVKDLKRFELLGFLENKQRGINSYIKNTYADSVDYKSRYKLTFGERLGVLTESGTNIPIQELPNIKSQGFINFDASLSGVYNLSITNNELVTSVDNVFMGNKIKETLKIGSSNIITQAISTISNSTDLWTLSDTDLPQIFSTGTFYTSNWSGSTCNPGTMTVNTTSFNASGGTLSFNALSLAPNTIYKVSRGTYNFTGPANSAGHISFGGNCIAMVGEDLENTYFTTNLSNSAAGNAGLFTSDGKDNIILYNIKIDGKKTSTHKYRYGLHLRNNSNNVTFNNIKVYNCNYHGIFMDSSKNYNLNNISTYNNNRDGVNFDGADYNILTNINTYSNGEQGLDFYNNSEYNELSNINSYDNDEDGIIFEDSDHNKFTNLNVYYNGVGGGQDGIDYTNGSSYSVFTNVLVYNNGRNGFDIDNTQYNTFNNVQVFNNDENGLDLDNSNYNTFNNIQSYNNGVRGTYLNNSDNNKFNNIKNINNNSNISIPSSTNNKYYGIFIIENSSVPSGFSVGTNGDKPITSWTGGTYTRWNSSMSCIYHIQPNLVSSWGATCQDKGDKTTGITSPVTNYIYGSSIPLQITPVKYIGSTLYEYGTGGIDYDELRYIGQY